jgi:hypothetical protein
MTKFIYFQWKINTDKLIVYVPLLAAFLLMAIGCFFHGRKVEALVAALAIGATVFFFYRARKEVDKNNALIERWLRADKSERSGTVSKRLGGAVVLKLKADHVAGRVKLRLDLTKVAFAGLLEAMRSYAETNALPFDEAELSD